MSLSKFVTTGLRRVSSSRAPLAVRAFSSVPAGAGVTSHSSWQCHDSVHFVRDDETGLRGIIAIHDTLLGPALGGCRLWTYQNESDAISDVLRLSRGMTFKASCANLDLGGGKAVILGPAPEDPAKRAALFQRFGEFVESLGGKYITAEDVGTSTTDMVAVRAHTNNVRGLPLEHDGSGDPSPITARGTFLGMLAAVEHRLGQKDLSGLKVLVQGVGHVGIHLVEMCRDSGAQVFVADRNQAAVQEAVDKFGAQSIPVASVSSADVDVYAPCALGGALTSRSVQELRCRVVAGAANNQLLNEAINIQLKQRGILYAPDYVINAGGLINVSLEGPDYPNLSDELERRLDGIPSTLRQIFERASADAFLTESEAAYQIARERLEAAAQKRGAKKSTW